VTASFATKRAWLTPLLLLGVACATPQKPRELEAFDRSIDVHMGRIRAAIEDDVKNPKRILTVRGVGYVFAKQQD